MTTRRGFLGLLAAAPIAAPALAKAAVESGFASGTIGVAINKAPALGESYTIGYGTQAGEWSFVEPNPAAVERIRAYVDQSARRVAQAAFTNTAGADEMHFDDMLSVVHDEMADPRWREQVAAEPPAPLRTRLAWPLEPLIPNRLYGAEITEDGDVI